MLICWNEQPKQRPTFKELRAKFDAMLLAEKKDMYIALCIDENKSYYRSLTSDKHLLTRKKLASARQSSVSLDEAQTADRRKGSDHTRRPDRLSLQLFTHGQQGQPQDRYVPSPALSPTHQKSQGGLEMESIKQNNPKIEVTVSEY